MGHQRCRLRGCGCRIGPGRRAVVVANDNDVDEIACLLAELTPAFPP
jgi:hypothetical protein